MSGINEGIKQPLRFYDTPDKQNWRKCHVHGAGFADQMVVLNPENTIIPFQIRRKRSSHPVTVFDLWKWDDSINDFAYDFNLLTIIPAPTTDHMRVIQMQQVDNIVWYPKDSFTANLDCGLYYVVVGDGITTWYSEVFKVISGFNSEEITYITTLPIAIGLQQEEIIGWTSGGIDYELIISKHPR